MKRTPIAIMAIIGLLFAAAPALADGTQAGSTVNNTATVSYTVGGVAQTAIESSPTGNSVPGVGNGTATGFTVDQKIDLLVTTTDASAVTIVPGGTAVTTFTVKNEGNDTQDIRLSAVALPNTTANPFGGALTDNFDSSAAVVFYVENGAAGFQGTEPVVTYLDEMTNGETRTVYMRITAPGTQVQNDLAVYALKGTVRAGGTATTEGAALTNDAGGNTIGGAQEIVFADSAGSDDTTGLYDAEHSARSAYVVSTATLTVTKSVAVFNTGGGLPSDTYPIPGAVMTYTITIANAASGTTASGITLVDAIPTGTAFYVTSGPTGGDGSGTQYEYSNQTPFNPAAPTWTETPAADGNGVDTGVTAIKIKAADIAAGASATVTFKVKIL